MTTVMTMECVQPISKIGQNRGIVVKFVRTAVPFNWAYLILSAFYLTFINVGNKLSRRTFAATFFLAALVALEVQGIRLEDI